LLLDPDKDDEFFELNYSFYCDGNGKIVKLRGHEYIKIADLVMNQKMSGGKCFDHINRNSHDNQRLNLRPATSSQNSFNKGVRKDNSTGYKGVGWCKPAKKWRARLRINGAELHLGVFDTEHAAAKAYDEAAKIHHGEFAYLNFPGT